MPPIMQVIPSAYLIGLKDLRRQRDQERLGWLTPAPPLPLAVPLSQRDHSPLADRERTLQSGSGDDDGTHDIFSPRRGSSPDPNVTEMREVNWDRTIPISIPIASSASQSATVRTQTSR